MSDTIVPAWKQVTPELRQEVMEFWLSEGALDEPEAAAKRTEQVVCVGRDGDGAIWAVGTAFLGVLSTLGQPTYFCRAFIAARRRGSGGMMPFFRSMRDLLEDYNRGLPQPESIGIMLELQNEMLSKRYRLAYEPEADAYFIGYSPRGHQLRVVYFEGARLLLPPGAVQRPAAPAAGPTGSAA